MTDTLSNRTVICYNTNEEKRRISAMFLIVRHPTSLPLVLVWHLNGATIILLYILNIKS